MIRLQIQSDAKEGLLDIVQAGIPAEVKRLEIGLHRTERQIERFEKEYSIIRLFHRYPAALAG